MLDEGGAEYDTRTVHSASSPYSVVTSATTCCPRNPPKCITSRENRQKSVVPFSSVPHMQGTVPVLATTGTSRPPGPQRGAAARWLWTSWLWLLLLLLLWTGPWAGRPRRPGGFRLAPAWPGRPRRRLRCGPARPARPWEARPWSAVLGRAGTDPEREAVGRSSLKGRPGGFAGLRREEPAGDGRG